MTKESIKSIVAAELEPFLEKNGYELYDVKFTKEAKDWFLRVYVDKKPRKTERIEGAGKNGEPGEINQTTGKKETEEYIGVDDCEKVSKFLSMRLDEKNPIEQNYYLEVSSPGLDRELRKEADYQRFAGKQAEVKLYKAIDGIKKIEGTLEGLVDEKVIVIDQQGKRWELPLEQVAKTNLAVVF